ncbi:MAG: head GIN domain-containing protein [Bacteroidota bacterium]
MKKSNLLLLIALGLILIAILAGTISVRSMLFANVIKGDGNIVETPRDINSFEKINIKGRYKVFYTQDTTQQLVLRADANLHEYIVTTIRNNELVIKSNQPIRSDSELHIELSNPNITHIEASANAGFFTRNSVTLPLLYITSNAGSEVNVEGIFESLFATQNAGSDIILRGQTNLLNLISNAGGNIDASQMEAQSASVETNAGASAIVNAEEIDAKANAGGSIRYLGDPVFRSMNTSAGGSIGAAN